MKVLITAFEPFGEWEENSSLLCLEGVRRELQLPASSAETTETQIVSRIYPVDFGKVRAAVETDLESEQPDVVLHLGQATFAPVLLLERIAINTGSDPKQPEVFFELAAGGDLAYATDLPLEEWAALLSAAEIPARVSHHAGTYVCNASFYWSLYLQAERGFTARPAFVHVPLAPEQARRTKLPENCLATSQAVRAICLLVEHLSPSGGRLSR